VTKLEQWAKIFPTTFNNFFKDFPKNWIKNDVVSSDHLLRHKVSNSKGNRTRELHCAILISLQSININSFKFLKILKFLKEIILRSILNKVKEINFSNFNSDDETIFKKKVSELILNFCNFCCFWMRLLRRFEWSLIKEQWMWILISLIRLLFPSFCKRSKNNLLFKLSLLVILKEIMSDKLF